MKKNIMSSHRCIKYIKCLLSSLDGLPYDEQRGEVGDIILLQGTTSYSLPFQSFIGRLVSLRKENRDFSYKDLIINKVGFNFFNCF